MYRKYIHTYKINAYTLRESVFKKIKLIIFLVVYLDKQIKLAYKYKSRTKNVCMLFTEQPVRIMLVNINKYNIKTLV